MVDFYNVKLEGPSACGVLGSAVEETNLGASCGSDGESE